MFTAQPIVTPRDIGGLREWIESYTSMTDVVVLGFNKVDEEVA